MKNIYSYSRFCFYFLLFILFSTLQMSCSSSESFSVGGSVSGLSGTLVLQNNNGDNLTLTENGNFTFLNSLSSGSAYSVSVLTQPSAQICTVVNGAGTVNASNVVNVSVTCSAQAYTVGGDVTGLSGSLVLQNNSSDDLVLSSDGEFVFETPVADTASYNVTVLTQPAGQTCVVSNGSGAISGANIVNVGIACSASVLAPTLSGISPNSGDISGGTAFTLTGTNLLGTTLVSFDGVAATSVIVVNATTVTGAAPAHSVGAVNISVTTPGGTATSNAAYTYTAIPSVSVVNPTSGSASGGTGFTLTGSNLTGTTSITFGGIAATSVNVVNSTTLTGVTPAHSAGALDVEVTTPLGTGTASNAYTYVATAIGQSSYGGIIACLNGGSNDLIAATANNSSGIEWGSLGIATGATSVTDGSSNSATIVAALGSNGGTPYAAQICDTYEVDSQGNTPCEAGNTCYNDWFLPAGNNGIATGQLNCLFTNRLALGGFTSDFYWSSTENNANTAYAQAFDSGAEGTGSKVGTRPVRCVRAFTP